MFRVIWQYGKSIMGPLGSPVVPLGPMSLRRVDPLFADLPLIGSPEPVFPISSMRLRREHLSLPEAVRELPELDLAGFHHAFLATRDDAERLRHRMLNEPGVISVQVQARPDTPYRRQRNRRNDLGFVAMAPVPGAPDDVTPSFDAMQGYLDAAPAGIDAQFAWTRPGGRGEGIRAIDIEWGWNFSHEDLHETQIGVVYGPHRDDDHGTAVLGIFSGDDNAFGVSGIVPEAFAAGSSAEYDGEQHKWNAAAAIYDAVRRLRAGDAILLEMHAPGPKSPDPNDPWQRGFIAIEYWDDEFAAIAHATARGIHVIEAAGNGGEHLDDAAYDRKFDRTLRDSGALLVGGGRSANHAAPRSRIDWSNWGSRLDLQGWGEDIVTCGGHEQGYSDLQRSDDASRCYTDSFGGTSGASPIVLGAVVAISACLKAARRPSLTPVEMRELLVETGTPQADGPDGGADQHIGPLPNLRGALAALGLD